MWERCIFLEMLNSSIKKLTISGYKSQDIYCNILILLISILIFLTLFMGPKVLRQPHLPGFAILTFTVCVKISIMNSLNFTFINSVSETRLNSIEDVLGEGRLFKYLWIEFILNPEAAATGSLHLDNEQIRESLTSAVSWYAAYKWLFRKNDALESLYKSGGLVPYKIGNDIYREYSRVFLKGIIHAGLC